MKVIETTRFGTIEVEEDRIFKFVQPLLGFEHLNDFVLIDHAPDSPFKWLQAVVEPQTAFIVTNPVSFGIEYEFTVPEEDVQRLDLQNAEDALVLTIVYIPQGAPDLMTANLAGPIIINTRNRKGMQLVLSDSRFSTKHRLLKSSEDKARKTSRS
ncbi:MAG: flagellar assembly protein FliW [Cyanobacteriota bacterium]